MCNCVVNPNPRGIAVKCLDDDCFMVPDVEHVKGAKHEDGFGTVYEAWRCPKCRQKVTTRRIVDGA